MTRFARRVLSVGRHELASSGRKSSVAVAAVIAPAAVFLAAGGDAYPIAAGGDADPVVPSIAPCCWEIVAAAPTARPSAPSVGQSNMSSAPGQLVSVSSWRVVDRDTKRLLPVGVAPERGLQVNTVLAARSISAAFPEIHHIGGVRPDSLRWHPDGLAIDVNIPNYDTAQGKALGDEIVAFVLENADRFGLDHAIWRGTFYVRNGAQGLARSRGSGHADHYDHVHIATNGGGYPTGSETYFR